MVEEACPECGADFESVWRVRVATNPQGYEPAAAGPTPSGLIRQSPLSRAFAQNPKCPARAGPARPASFVTNR